MLDTIFINVFTLLSLIVVTISLYLLWVGSHWKRKGVPSYGNAITGAFQDMFRKDKCIGVCLKDLYSKTLNQKYLGTFIFGQPVLVLQDREIIKQVLLKDYPSFASHGIYYDKERDPLSGHLFNLAAADWKFMRTKLTPSFTSGKVKYMFQTVQKLVSTFYQAVDKERQSQNDVVNIRDLLARLGTDVITSVAFGIEANSVENNNAIFRKVGKSHFEPQFVKFLRFLSKTNYKLSKLLYTQSTTLEIDQFFREAFRNTVEYREKNNVTRNDFLDLLIRLKNDDVKSGSEFLDKKITTEEIAAQSWIFFIAGFETSSSTSGFALFELAKHPEIQRKVQEECDRVMEACGGVVTYDAVQSMQFTDRVLQETMRLYPALPYIPRAATKSCKLPTTDIFLEKDTIIWVPILALHMDERHFKNPHAFDPDRFTEENKKYILPYSYMPFGDGPRHCIGKRFALVLMKTVLLEVMSRYNVELATDDREMEFHPLTFVIAPKGEFRLKVTPRKD